MPMPNKRRIFSSQLPPTPVTPELRDLVAEYADKNHLPLVEVTRRALNQFFAAVRKAEEKAAAKGEKR